MTGSTTSVPPPPGRPAAGSGPRSELRLRIVSAVVLALLATLATWLGGVPFAALWAVAAGCAVWEWFSLIAPKVETEPGSPRNHYAARLSFLRTMAASGMGALPLLPALGLWAATGACAVAAVTAAAGWSTLARRGGAGDDKWQRAFGRRILLWAFAGLIVGALAGLVPVLARAVPGIGAILIAWMFAVVWTTDIAAYFTGRAIGGPKLWPSVSPNKTWAGLAGGAAGGMLAGWLVACGAEAIAGIAPWNAAGTLAASLLASIVGQGGDLAESALKRRAGVKDSGRIIPGHGGVLDRIDGFLAVCLLMAIGLASRLLLAQ